MLALISYYVVLPIQGFSLDLYRSYSRIDEKKRTLYGRAAVITLITISLIWIGYFIKDYMKNNEQNSFLYNICLSYLFGLLILVVAVWITVFIILVILLVLGLVSYSKHGWEIDWIFLHYCDFKSSNEQDGIQIKSRNSSPDRDFIKLLRRNKLNVRQLLDMNVNRANFKKTIFNSVTDDPSNTDFSDFVEYLLNFKIEELNLNFKKHIYFNAREISDIFVRVWSLRSIEFSFPKWQNQLANHDFYLVLEKMKLLTLLENLSISFYPNFPNECLEFFSDFLSHMKSDLQSFTIRIHPGENAKSVELSNFLSVLSKSAEKFQKLMQLTVFFKKIEPLKEDDLIESIALLKKLFYNNKRLLGLKIIYSYNNKQGINELTQEKKASCLRQILNRRNALICSACAMRRFLRPYGKSAITDIMNFYA